MEYASRGDRLVGQILDGLVGVVPMIVGGVAMFFLATTGLRLVGSAVFVIGIGVSAWYYLFADGLENGQSLGKRWTGTRVVDAESRQPCTFMQSFVRNILLSVLGPLDWIFIFGEKHQRLGDMAAGTVVIPAPR